MLFIFTGRRCLKSLIIICKQYLKAMLMMMLSACKCNNSMIRDEMWRSVLLQSGVTERHCYVNTCLFTKVRA